MLVPRRVRDSAGCRVGFGVRACQSVDSFAGHRSRRAVLGVLAGLTLGVGYG